MIVCNAGRICLHCVELEPYFLLDALVTGRMYLFCVLLEVALKSNIGNGIMK